MIKTQTNQTYPICILIRYLRCKPHNYYISQTSWLTILTSCGSKGLINFVITKKDNNHQSPSNPTFRNFRIMWLMCNFMAGGGGGDEEPSLQNVETKPHNHTCGSSQMPNPKPEVKTKKKKKMLSFCKHMRIVHFVLIRAKAITS